MSLKETATQTLSILEAGYFLTPEGQRLDIEPALREAVAGTRLYTPEQASAILEKLSSASTSASAASSSRIPIEVTGETTQIAARRLVELESVTDLALLNFASARNPGGGFINGAKAQEEDLCRCSGLYPCLMSQPEYYKANRDQQSTLYTDHLIYSPNVPWFRTRSRDQPHTMFLASVITAPAPNAGVVLSRAPDPTSQLKAQSEIETALRRRAGLVLAIGAEHGHRTLLLGAWGCGVFRNSPALVADAFGKWIESATFAGAFDRVVFAIYSTSKDKSTLSAFKERFSQAELSR